MNQVAGNQMRLYDLPSKLLCRVLNVELKVPSSSRRVFLPVAAATEWWWWRRVVAATVGFFLYFSKSLC